MPDKKNTKAPAIPVSATPESENIAKTPIEEKPGPSRRADDEVANATKALISRFDKLESSIKRLEKRVNLAEDKKVVKRPKFKNYKDADSSSSSSSDPEPVNKRPKKFKRFADSSDTSDSQHGELTITFQNSDCEVNEVKTP